MKDKFILGGGMSGLIFKYYNPDFTIIEPKKVGGSVNLNIGADIVFLFRDKDVENFLRELKVKFKVKKLRIRYFYHNKMYKVPTEEMNDKYIARKLSHASFPINLTKQNMKPRQSKDASYLDVNFKDVISKLSKNIEIIDGKAILVDSKNQVITLSNYKRFKYDKLISTIPAHDFRYIAYNLNLKNNFRYLPGTFLTTEDLPLFLSSAKGKFDILYYCNDDMIFNRIWSTPRGYVYEIPGDFSREECENYFDEMGVKIIGHNIRRVNVIFNEDIKKIENIDFVGRLAKWNSNSFINDAIRFAKNYKR